jgi:catechol 2,3-dioxygenase-like lactoylglutathione lyase family enzyme
MFKPPHATAWPRSSDSIRGIRECVTVLSEEFAMSNFIQITPFMHVQDIEKALAFFNDILGFETQLRMANYAYLHRETVGFRILQEKGPDGAPPGNRRFAYYIDVRDVDKLYEELKAKLDTLPPRDVYGPVNQPYGQRELLVLAPDGNLIAFGHAIQDSKK